ncbi:hypothetical protein VaNZ11_014110 [Volvox africanus]|uniref:Uncharacterized protein n=1 Tax=Volvox africanus TaxID=51714 RepID=A0ABQ5SJ19_9CHLO|nr:hypothetical protein VaNZ11_014110 [Volvox africanus]
MSCEFIDVFFPSISKLLRSQYPRIWTHFFPPELQLKCARPTYDLNIGGEGRYVVPIHWPALALVIPVGVAIGLYGSLQLRVVKQWKPNRPPTAAWALAMGFYACMNIAALVSHCLVQRSSPWQQIFISMDIGATACTAFSALYASIGDELSGGFQTASANDGGNGSKGNPNLNLFLGNAILTISAFIGLDIPFMAELLYIGTTVLSAIVVGIYICRRPCCGRQRLFIWLVFTGGATALSGLPLDTTLCRELGPHVNHVTMLFVGCHMTLLGLFLYAQEELVVRHNMPAAAAMKQVVETAAGDTAKGEAAATGEMAGAKTAPGSEGASLRKRK